jgi:hypothetical protein
MRTPPDSAGIELNAALSNDKMTFHSTMRQKLQRNAYYPDKGFTRQRWRLIPIPKYHL